MHFKNIPLPSQTGSPSIVNNLPCPILGRSCMLSSTSWPTSSFKHRYSMEESLISLSFDCLQIEPGNYYYLSHPRHRPPPLSSSYCFLPPLSYPPSIQPFPSQSHPS